MNFLSNYFIVVLIITIHVRNIQSFQSRLSLLHYKALAFNNGYKLTQPITLLSATTNHNNNNQYQKLYSKITKNISIFLISLLSYNIIIPEQVVLAKPEGIIIIYIMI